MLTNDGKYWLIRAKRGDVWFYDHPKIARFGDLGLSPVVGLMVVFTLFPTIRTLIMGTFMDVLPLFITLYVLLFVLLLAYAQLRYLDHRSLKHYQSGYRWPVVYNGVLTRPAWRFELRMVLAPQLLLNRSQLWQVRTEIDKLVKRYDDTIEIGLGVDHRRKELVYREGIMLDATEILVSCGMTLEDIDAFHNVQLQAVRDEEQSRSHKLTEVFRQYGEQSMRCAGSYDRLVEEQAHVLAAIQSGK